jgi:hypothetical protein
MNVYDILMARGVTRLCHITKFQNLTHIVHSPDGILASNSIRSDTKNVIDKARYDGELDYICCSFEYPNSWYLRSAKYEDTNKIFIEWIVLYINLKILNYRNAKFCPGNASKEKGKYISSNIEHIESIFAVSVPTFSYQRSQMMLSCCPTDGQAEILIKNSIPRDFISGIAVGNDEIAKRIFAMLKTYRIKQIPIYIAPDVLTPSWSKMVRNGERPSETECIWSEED